MRPQLNGGTLGGRDVDVSMPSTQATLSKAGSNSLSNPMRRARLAIALLGIMLPYLARVPGMLVGGSQWLSSYLAGGVSGMFLLAFFNLPVWGSLLGLSFLVRKPSPLVLPAIFGFGFVAYAHAGLDLGADAQAAVALIFIPLYALPIIAITSMFSVGLLGRGPNPVSRPARK